VCSDFKYFLADPARFELTTFAFVGQRSIQLRYGSDAAAIAEAPALVQRVRSLPGSLFQRQSVQKLESKGEIPCATAKKLAYDAFADVTAVTLACSFDFGFCVGPAVPDSVKGIPEFPAWCKDNPDKANYGSPAAGSLPHFIGVLLGQAGDVELKHVACRGSKALNQPSHASPPSRSCPWGHRMTLGKPDLKSRFCGDIQTGPGG
jgi:Tripartite tricarboxylate transporter family receptor